jgi:hypothetical protein
MVLVYNISTNAINIANGDRIAQAELVKDAEYTISESAVRPGVKTNRTGGMGSTGITDKGGTITLNISEPKIPDFVKTKVKKSVSKKTVAKIPEKRGRGRPKKNA